MKHHSATAESVRRNFLGELDAFIARPPSRVDLSVLVHDSSPQEGNEISALVR